MIDIKNKKISVVVPVYNEEGSLDILVKEIIKGLDSFKDWEIIFIDDGSTDRSPNILREISNENLKIKVITLNQNLGKSIALSEGFSHANNDYIITMDGDLQDDPAEIKELILKIDSGYDLVSGWKRKRKDPLSKKIPSKFFNFITSIITGIKLHDFNCGLKAYKRGSIIGLDLYGGMHRYIPVILHNRGFKVTEIPVNHRPRKYGNSKYGKSRYAHGFFDFITVLFLGKYFNRPLHFFGIIGFPIFFSGIAVCSYLTFQWFIGIWIANRPLFFLGILLVLVGIQFISIGLIGELFINKFSRKSHRVINKANINN